MKRIYSLAILCILAILITGCSDKAVLSLAVAFPLSDEQQKDRGLAGSCDDYYAENVQTYRTLNGQKAVYLYSAPIEQSGNEIVEAEEGFEANGTYFYKSFPIDLSADMPITIEGENNFINVFLPGDSYSGQLIEEKNAFGITRTAVLYKDAFGKEIHLYCYPTSFGVNTEIRIPEKTAQHTFKIKVQLPDWVPDTNSPDYILFKSAMQAGTVKSMIYTPLVCDANGKWCYANTVQLLEKDPDTDTYTVEYTVDSHFLSDEDTVYPVTLNQSFHLYKSKQPDTSAYENTGEVASHYLSPYILLGDSTLKGEGWTYIRYETLNDLDIDPDKIVSAKYIFRNLFDLERETKLSAYPVTADWCSINTRWYNRPPNDETPVSEVIVDKAGDYELDVTSLLTEMIRNKGKYNPEYSVQNSFLIRSDTKNSNVLISSGDNGLFSPMLEIKLSE